jgi:hypothetical protein
VRVSPDATPISCLQSPEQLPGANRHLMFSPVPPSNGVPSMVPLKDRDPIWSGRCARPWR